MADFRNQEKFQNAYAAWMESVVEQRWADKYNVIWWVGVIPTLAAVATIGNILVVFVAAMSPKFRTVSCIFLTNLAAIDIVQSAAIVPFRVFETFIMRFPFSQYWICKSIYVMREALFICYVETFVLIAVERYIVVVYPMKAVQIWTKRRARLAVLAVWLLAFLLAAPTWFQMSLLGVEHGWPICVRDIIRRNYPGVDVTLWRKIHESYSLFLLYFLPLAALMICYSIVAIALYRSIKSTLQLTQQNSTGSSQFRGSVRSETSMNFPHSNRFANDMQRERVLVLRMCVVLVAVFGICQGPWRIHYWINVMLPKVISLGPKANGMLRAPFFALSVLNSAVNPFIYGFMSKRFRQAFVLVVAKCCFIPIQVYHRSVRWKHERQSRKEIKDSIRNRAASDGSKSTSSRTISSSASKMVPISFSKNNLSNGPGHVRKESGRRYNQVRMLSLEQVDLSDGFNVCPDAAENVHTFVSNDIQALDFGGPTSST